MFGRKRRRQMGHEFQSQKMETLPADLWLGPPPDAAGTGEGMGLGQGAISQPSRSMTSGLDEPWKTLMYGIQRKGNYTPTSGTVGNTQALLIRPKEERIYLLIQNTSVANSLIVGVGYQPTVVTGGSTGIILAPNGGSFEPQVIPQGDVWLLGSGVSTFFVVWVALG